MGGHRDRIRMIKINYNLIIILMVVLIVAGCKGGSNKEEYTPGITSKDIYTGNEGLVMEFFENAPPAQAFELNRVPVGIKMKNQGAFDISDGHMSIGLEDEYIGLDSNSFDSAMGKSSEDFAEKRIKFSLNGKTVEHPYGEQEIITFNLQTKSLMERDKQSEYHDSFFTLTSCYRYNTIATETICIDADIYDAKQRQKSCEVNEISLNSQGAPVAVTKIETEMLPERKSGIRKVVPMFMITVKNIGLGEVFAADKADAACSSEAIGYKEWGRITLSAYISKNEQDYKLDCVVTDVTNDADHEDGILNLKGKEDTIRCAYQAGFNEERGTFPTPLYIKLDYGYTHTISKEIRIKKMLTH